MTKEERKEYQKEYDIKYYQDNKEKRDAQNKANYESKKDGLYTVYLLPKHRYVGMTDNLHKRLTAHKSANHNRNIEGAEVLGKYKTREEAMEVEATYHSKGFNGRHPNAKKQKK
tara:strand:+ start:222 stop:563 length:342 start_codon:yes stop_codon:yes gene_type:complete